MSEVRQERSGWRCESYSKWHRHLGWNVPTQDVDVMLFNEYDNFRPTCIIELKDEHAKTLAYDAPQAKAHRNLANGYKDDKYPEGLPFFVVYHKSDLSKSVVHPFNKAAHDKIGKIRSMGAGDYVRFLYWLRDRKAPEDVVLNAEKAAKEIEKEMYVE